MIGEGVIEIRRELSLAGPAGGNDRAPSDWLDALPEADGLDCRDWVCMDTETTGLAGGTGTLVFLLGLARLQRRRLVTRQYLCTRIAAEPAMLRAGLAWCAGAGLITYNGKRFDRPLLDTRCRMHRLVPHWQDRPEIDLLYPVRRAFQRYWPDCRLQSAE